ncbi:DUF642 domain-containing protein [Nostoc sp. MS1]|uniref:DUF642 domain-containing protein n=1 Tax=Nostoc sp. MS1 TaxID=2764711 RepID=UPI001CC490FE|nr:DUF642 domain-containing protein [Nostoc sp. MS1]BCL34446.1 hypothetical protein NSMS1_08930 [Nostoc sp. MS1]
MQSRKKFSVNVYGLAITLATTATVTSAYIPTAQAANLVSNGDFELDASYNPNYNPNDPSTWTNNPNITGWTTTRNNPADQWISVIKGNYDAIIGYPDSLGTGKSTFRGGGYVNDGYLSQNLATTPGQVYQLKYRLRSNDLPQFTDNTFQAFIGGNKIYDLNNIPTNSFTANSYDPYTEYTYNFLATDTNTELKFAYRNPNGFFFLDNVSVEAVNEAPTTGGTITVTGVQPGDIPPSVPATGRTDYPQNDPRYIVLDPKDDPKYSVDPKNIVVNGSFETDPLVSPVDPTLPNPFITGWVNDSDAIGDGTYLFRQSNAPNTGFRSLDIRGTGFFSQELNTVVGQEYLLSYQFLSVEESTPGNPFLGNIFRTYIDGNVIDEKVDSTWRQGFTKYQYKFVATSPTTELKFFGRVNHDWLTLDDVSVVPVSDSDASATSVPEPSIVGGIVVLGMMGMRSKKKQLG